MWYLSALYADVFSYVAQLFIPVWKDCCVTDISVNHDRVHSWVIVEMMIWPLREDDTSEKVWGRNSPLWSLFHNKVNNFLSAPLLASYHLVFLLSHTRLWRRCGGTLYPALTMHHFVFTVKKPQDQFHCLSIALVRFPPNTTVNWILEFNNLPDWLKH